MHMPTYERNRLAVFIDPNADSVVACCHYSYSAPLIPQNPAMNPSSPQGGSSLTGGIPQDFCSQTSDVPGTFADLEIANCGAKKREEFAVVTFPPNINCTQLDETDPTNVLNCCGCASNDVGEVVRDCSNSRSCYSRLT